MTDLTDRQAEVLATIRRLTQKWRWAPTLRELMSELGINSTNGVREHLDALKSKGAVDWEHGKARTLHITVAGYRWLGAQEAA